MDALQKQIDAQKTAEQQKLQAGGEALIGKSIGDITAAFTKPVRTEAELVAGTRPTDISSTIREQFTTPGAMKMQQADEGYRNVLAQYKPMQEMTQLLAKYKQAEEKRKNELSMAQMDLENKKQLEKYKFDLGLLKEEKKLASKTAKEDNAIKLTQAMTMKVNEGRAIPTTLDTVAKTIQNNKSIMGPIEGRMRAANPYDTQAQVFDAEMRAASQQFGRYMEGGVLRKEDEEKYRKMFPSISNTPEVAQGRLKVVKNLLERKYKSDLEALGSQGYSIKGLDLPKLEPNEMVAEKSGMPSIISSATAQEMPRPVKETMPEVGVIQKGYKFLGGDPSQSTSWEKQ